MAVEADLKEQLMPALTAGPDTSVRQMMGTTSFFVRGRMFAFWAADGIVVKTPRDGHADLMRTLGSSPFAGPQGRGFGEWMHVPVTEDNVDDVKRVIGDACRYVAGSAKTPVRRKKKR